jgi:hypothetical protein
MFMFHARAPGGVVGVTVDVVGVAVGVVGRGAVALGLVTVIVTGKAPANCGRLFGTLGAIAKLDRDSAGDEEEVAGVGLMC